MKLAEGLLLRSEYQQKLEGIQQRILKNLKVQEGDEPGEYPETLLKEYSKINEELSFLVTQINACNQQKILDDGRTISEALIAREEMVRKRKLLVLIQSTATDSNFRRTRAEIKIKTTVNISRLQREIDHLSKEFRKLDTLIRKTNWSVDL
ncbi:DIP1984 family protein [Enterococcus sp. BWB1-3]|uniref:DIP1984 family protein n=1 Tax=unclassified Enterococcus TaxID=2608891 RepID=UPI0019244AE0|nr:MULTISPECIES: DIP1984 family protein [unclassified Enterococcus]MBL1230787.1 DIP1984 family protein [Enterococcus sp. BWB1-3]MCB5950670.1 DIP1984 family protein [Enterococcus sp. BWT-B8]MCB5955631.1 DIP1984 family protein [Enterococcus sp. CWB-B31]